MENKRGEMGRNKQSLKLLSDIIGKREKRGQGNERKTKEGKGFKLINVKEKGMRRKHTRNKEKKKQKNRSCAYPQKK